MKRALLSLALLGVVSCADTGRVPFQDGALFDGGKSKPVPGNGGTTAHSGGGTGGTSGFGGTGGFGGTSGYGGTGGFGGTSGFGGTGGGGPCLGGPGTSCSSGSDCCQVDQYGDTCLNAPVNQCAAICYSSSFCLDHCCVQLNNQSYGACIKNSSYPCMP